MVRNLAKKRSLERHYHITAEANITMYVIAKEIHDLKYRFRIGRVLRKKTVSHLS